jgi:hypothetical protein
MGAPTDAGAGGTLANAVYTYSITGVNELGESVSAATQTVTPVAAHYVTIAITNPSTAVYFNVYRSDAGGSTLKWIGRVAKSGASTTFSDYGAKIPGFVTGYLIQGDTMEVRELSPYSRLKLAVTDLSIPEAHFRFLTLTVPQPRKNVLVDNLKG